MSNRLRPSNKAGKTTRTNRRNGTKSPQRPGYVFTSAYKRIVLKLGREGAREWRKRNG